MAGSSDTLSPAGALQWLLLLPQQRWPRKHAGLEQHTIGAELSHSTPFLLTSFADHRTGLGRAVGTSGSQKAAQQVGHLEDGGTFDIFPRWTLCISSLRQL